MTEPGPATPPPHPQGPLTLRGLCAALIASGELRETDAERVLSGDLGSAPRSTGAGRRHPLERIAEAGLTRARDGHPLDLESLTQWLADWAGQPYLHIDPLRIDTPAIARVMSYGLCPASRHPGDGNPPRPCRNCQRRSLQDGLGKQPAPGVA